MESDCRSSVVMSAPASSKSIAAAANDASPRDEPVRYHYHGDRSGLPCGDDKRPAPSSGMHKLEHEMNTEKQASAPRQ